MCVLDLRLRLRLHFRLIVIARKADWRPGGGWEGLRIGYHWGGTTIQGMIPYYFGMKAPLAWRRIVDRCLYNNMADLNCTKMCDGFGLNSGEPCF